MPLAPLSQPRHRKERHARRCEHEAELGGGVRQARGAAQLVKRHERAHRQTARANAIA
jgi:hypothetical protein